MPPDSGIENLPYLPPAGAPLNMDALFPWNMTPDATNSLVPLSPISSLTSTTFDMHSLHDQSTKDGTDGSAHGSDALIYKPTASPTMPTYGHDQFFLQHPTLPSQHPLQQTQFIPPCPTLEFCPPIFSEFSDRKNRRHLVDHFCNTLSHLIVFREEHGNPFQRLVLPMTGSSPAVMNTVYALSSAHLEYRGVKNVEKSEIFHARAIQELARVIERGQNASRSELLAAIMLLIYYEVVRHLM